jgi:hypothetical protein
MKFVLFVEGHTEKKCLQGFLKKWLDAQELQQRVGIQVVRFPGWPELVKDSPTKAKLHLERSDVIGVIALLDLYGPTFYPKNKTTTAARYDWAKADLEAKVGDSRFRQFFAFHETEAWLLSNPDLFPREVRASFPRQVERPEDVNFDEPPSRLLARLYNEKTKRTYKKVTHGAELFDRLDPNVAYQKCPRLKELLDEMLQMATDSGL